MAAKGPQLKLFSRIRQSALSHIVAGYSKLIISCNGPKGDY